MAAKKKDGLLSQRKVDAELKKERERATARSEKALEAILERLDEKQIEYLVKKFPIKGNLSKQLKALKAFNKKLAAQENPGPILTLTGVAAVIKAPEHKKTELKTTTKVQSKSKPKPKIKPKK